MNVTVKNISAQIRDFDFERIRLIFPTYVANPSINLNPDSSNQNTSFFPPPPFYKKEGTIPKQGYLSKIKPDKEFSTRLIFIYYKEIYPYRLVYDQITNDRVTDKIAIDLPPIQKE